MTGARVKRVERYLGDADLFLCTYGDGLADVDLAHLVDFHRSHGRLATVTGVHAPARFGQLVADGRGCAVRREADRHRLDQRRLLRLRARVLRAAVARPACVLEHEPLERLAADGELRVFRHDGYWQCADTLRDVELLRGLWDAGQAPWRTWDSRIDPHGPNLGRRVTDAGLSPEAALRAAAGERAA